MITTRTVKALTTCIGLFAATGLLPISVAAAPKVEAPVDADTILRQMSDKIGGATHYSFNARREIESGRAGGDGLHGDTKISVTAQRPDKVVARATIPDDVRRLYFDGKQLTLVDEHKKTYSTVPLTASLDQLPSELARIYGFLPPAAEFLLSNLYGDLTFRAKSVEYAGTGKIKSGFLGLKSVHCHRILLKGTVANSELWIGAEDLLPRRWTSTVNVANGTEVIRLELSNWNLEAKTRPEEFVYTPAKDAMPIPMMTQEEIAKAHKQAK